MPRVPGLAGSIRRGAVSTRLASGAATVVLVHGLLMPAFVMALLARRLRRCGFRTALFGCRPRREGVAGAAARLHAFAIRQSGASVHFVAHSLGGLVVRQLFHDFPGQRPGRVVTLGTPHTGSVVARRLVSRWWGRWLLGRSFAHGLSGEVPPWGGRRELGVIAGSRAVGVGRLFAPLPLPNDGTVAVAETGLGEASARRVLPVSHTQLLVSAQVAREVCCFLHQGRFLGPTGRRGPGARAVGRGGVG